MREPTLEKSSGSRSRISSSSSNSGKVDPVVLADWLHEHEERIGERWLVGVESRSESVEPGVRDLLDEFFALASRFLPAFLSPYRAQIEPVWTQLSELYGSVAAMRGLAAGEVIEEFQILREELLRLFFDVPPVRDLDLLALREVLRINRIVDLGVTHASIGHTDALFFALFQGSGVASSLSEEQEREVRDQLCGIRTDLQEILSLLRR